MIGSYDILEAIGNVDDECVKRAKESKTSNKAMWISIAALAACLVLVFGVPAIRNFFLAGEKAPNESNRDEMIVVSGDTWIYYVDDDEIKREKEYLSMSAENIFNAWKEKNGIGDEVEFIKVRIESNGETTWHEHESGEGGAVEYEVGNQFIYNIRITENLKNYYDIIDHELLLESLEMTMTGYSTIEQSDIEFIEFNLILE